MTCYIFITHALTTCKQTMQCQIANPTNLETERPLTVTVHLGNQVQAVGTIRIREPLNLLVILIPMFAGVIVLIVAIFIIVVAVFRQKYQKAQQLTHFSAMQNLGQRWVNLMYTVFEYSIFHYIFVFKLCTWIHYPHLIGFDLYV